MSLDFPGSISYPAFMAATPVSGRVASTFALKMINRIPRICLIATALISGLCHAGEETPGAKGTDWISEKSLSEFRTRASNKQPTFEAFGWAVFKFETVFYGVFRAKGAPEFVATNVNEMDSEIRISGRSQIILNQDKRILVPDEGTGTLRGEKYEITGGRTKLIIGAPPK